MIRSALLAPLAFAACVEQTELLPPADASLVPPQYAFCPTTLDVYGSFDVLLPGCGGSLDEPKLAATGFDAPGDPAYDASLAGRLLARLAADPDLTPTFGTTWDVRACASPLADLTSVVPPLAADACGDDTPSRMGALTDLCSARPAPLAILLVDGTPDRCHGGGPDSSQPDDPETYYAHVATRLDAFLAARAPKLALVGPRTAWRPAPESMAMLPASERCAWARGDWDRGGLDAWRALHPDDATVVIEPDLHDESKRHGYCCAPLGLACETSWYGFGPMNASALNCDGAQAVVDFWYARLKSLLLGGAFACH